MRRLTTLLCGHSHNNAFCLQFAVNVFTAMNILPKKRWHVRTKENIARVRRDQAAAQEEEKKRQDKLEFAESEARINFLRLQSGLPEKITSYAPETTSGSNQKTSDADSAQSSVNKSFDLFADYKSHIKTTNKDLEKEKKEEQEKYEKQIGYLTYLGQDTNEALKVRSWYEVAPKRPEVGDRNTTEANLKQKLAQDPLTLINALIPHGKQPAQNTVKRKREPSPLPTPEPGHLSKIKKHKRDKKLKKHKKHKHKSNKEDRKAKELAESSAKRDKLKRLRTERLQREAAEQRRQELLFGPKKQTLPATGSAATAPTPRIVQKYNSQFNPDLAKQNML
ncbi:CG12818 [Drosophila busckii]|uniref:CG12818 n=1 Tax=Drosophila busckii TaxID=30019 RepID=A0A0M3QY48_DROBS|nr:leukocyte receptor cluster member 1 homolog [Drosophila busckii]ALC47053.1 CG12818 [Drosophila busckii]